mmetsp:Transcript_36713/g.65718  ORF Transcript_36713/g.65718 Transcript_36713/m.65718 type:complete len:200 (-) Transcript_36713:287-886(-)
MVPDTHCSWMAIAEPSKEAAPSVPSGRQHELQPVTGSGAVHRAPSLKDLLSISDAGPRPQSSTAEQESAETDVARIRGLESRVEEQEVQLLSQKETIKRLRREVDRLTAVSSQFMKEKNSTYMAWRKAQAHNNHLSAELAGLKSKQHKMSMKAANKMQNMQCKVDSVIYTAEEERKAHEAAVRDLQEKLEKATMSNTQC